METVLMDLFSSGVRLAEGWFIVIKMEEIAFSKEQWSRDKISWLWGVYQSPLKCRMLMVAQLPEFRYNKSIFGMT